MEYDRHVAVLQGSILGFETKPLTEHDRYLRLSKVLDSFLNIDRVITRKIFMCLLLNTDLSELEQMRKVPEYAPLSDLFRISTHTFMKLLTGNLWQSFIEAIPILIPDNVLNKIIGTLTKSKELLNGTTNENDRYKKILAITVAVILAMKLDNSEGLEKNIDITVVYGLINFHHDISLKSISFGNKLFGALYLLRIACSNATDILMKTSPCSITVSNDLAIPLTYTKTIECHKDMIDKLLNSYSKIVKEVTVEMWVDLSEVKTTTISCDFPYHSIWEVNKHVPSNLQSLLAHYSYEISQYVSSKKGFNSEAERILSSFAKEYNKISELRLHLITLREILVKLDELEEASLNSNNHADIDWKRSAYCEHLLSDMWDEVMGKTAGSNHSDAIKCIQALTNNARLVRNHCDKFYEEVGSHKDKTVKNCLFEKKLKLFLTTFKHLSIQGTHKILALRVTDHGVHSTLFFDSSSFQREFRNFLNKMVLKETTMASEEQKVDLYHFIVQSPKEVIFYLIEEAIQNKGKIDVVCEVLSLLPDFVVQYSVNTPTGKCMLITSALMLKFIVIHENDAKEMMENFYSLLKNIFSKMEDIAKNLALHFIRNADMKLLGSISSILGLAFEVTKVNTFRGDDVTLIMVWLCQVGSLVYEKKPWKNISMTTELPLLLEIMQTFYSDPSADTILLQKIIHNFLHNDLHGYLLGNLIGTNNIRDIIKTMYFNRIDMEYLPQTDLVIEIAASLPKLLPREWDILTSDLKVDGERISELDLLHAGQLLVSTASLENEHMEYVLQSLGNIISLRLQEQSSNIKDSGISTSWIKKLYSKLCQLIGRLMIIIRFL